MTYAIEGLAMCYPSQPTIACENCARYRPGFAMPAEQRFIPVIDGSVVVRSGVCPMQELRLNKGRP